MDKGYKFGHSPCPECGRVFADNWLIRHMKAEHPNPVSPTDVAVEVIRTANADIAQNVLNLRQHLADCHRHVGDWQAEAGRQEARALAAERELAEVRTVPSLQTEAAAVISELLELIDGWEHLPALDYKLRARAEAVVKQTQEEGQ